MDPPCQMSMHVHRNILFYHYKYLISLPAFIIELSNTVMANTMKARFPLLLLLGIVFLVSVSVCYGYGNAPPRQGNPCHEKCLRNCNRMNDANRRHECEAHCEEWAQERCEEEEEEEEEQPRHREPGRREPWRRKESPPREEEEEEERRERPSRPWRPHQKEQGRKERQRGTEEGEEEEERRERQPRPWRPHQKEQGRKEEEEEREWRGHGRREDPEERRRRREREEREEGQVSESSGRNNPFYFNSNNFETRYENENGYVRIVERFDKRSKIFENLQNYRVSEYKSKPHTLVLPHHFDADSILIVVSGRAILTLVYPNDRDSYNLERGDSITIPPGTTIYIANRDENEDLRLVKLSIPVNRPGKLRNFFPASSQNQQSYLYGFSEDVLEAAFNTEYEKIDRVLFGEERQRGQQRQRQEEGLIVKLSREDIQELSRHAKSSSRKTISSESKPFNLRDRNPLYSNKFGNFYEITPEKSPQLEELDIFLSWVEFEEGALLLPYFNSRSTVIGVVSEGEGELELVGPKEEQQQEGEEEEEEGRRNVQRYRAKLSRGDVIVIPASHPVAINATSNLKLLGFGINAEDNERNFLAGENDNLISQIHRAVKDLAFPGSAEDLERLIRNQKHSHFANAQPQQREEGRQGRRSPLSSILGAFY